MLVPFRTVYAVSLALYAERTLEPGATMSGLTAFVPVAYPRLLNEDIPSEEVVEPTVCVDR